jgi:hypothetical protein
VPGQNTPFVLYTDTYPHPISYGHAIAIKKVVEPFMNTKQRVCIFSAMYLFATDLTSLLLIKGPTWKQQ